ncbi:hypothetical protein EDD16DRAFT_1490439, partial [Pisolithus croceorrhizus]
VHDPLIRAFWDGINISHPLKYSPERCAVIATYGHLVVGVALLSSPRETYITHLAVRAGWDNSKVATYASPCDRFGRHWNYSVSLDLTQSTSGHHFHVSADNPAMVCSQRFLFLLGLHLPSTKQLLYNRLGFRAEEFIVGFYGGCLSSQSRASMNAFGLRRRK